MIRALTGNGGLSLKKERMEMIQTDRKKNIIAMLLVLVFVMLTFAVEGLAHQRPYRHHHSKTKGAIIGGVVGAVGGGLIGGKKGAVIGAGAGAGTGYLVQRHRNRRHRRVYR
jgi:hypothetical protein